MITQITKECSICGAPYYLDKQTCHCNCGSLQKFVDKVTGSNDEDISVIGKSNSPMPFFPSEKRRKIIGSDGSWEFEYFNLVNEFDPILQRPTQEWNFENPPGDLRYISISLIQTMVKNNGVGLAANQVGLPYSIFVMGAGQYANAIINPKIVKISGEEIGVEGCLTFPGLYLKIKRGTHIEVEFYDMNGVKQIKTFEGLTARIFLHEYDHLQGIVYTGLVSKFNLQKQREKVKSNLKRIRRAKEENDRKLKIASLAQRASALKKSISQQPKTAPPTITITGAGQSSNNDVGVIDLSTYNG